MNKKVALVFGAAAVLIAAIAIYVQLQSSSAKPPDATPVATAGSGSATKRPQPDHQATVTTGSHPRGSAQVTDPVVTEIDNTVIRDHRTGSDRTPIDQVPPPHRGKREIPPTLTQAITQKMLAVIQECGKAVPAAERGAKPRVTGAIAIAIANRQASITSASVKVRDVDGPSLAAAQQCIEQKSIGLSTPAADQEDLDHHDISISFAIVN